MNFCFDSTLEITSIFATFALMAIQRGEALLPEFSSFFFFK